MTKKETYYLLGGCIVLCLAFLARLYYSVDVYTFTFGSGDATEYVLRSIYFMQEFFVTGRETQPSAISSEMFGTPFLVPYFLGVLSVTTGISPDLLPFFFTGIAGCVVILLIYLLVSKQHSVTLAFLVCIAIAINTYHAFYSTEPIKSIFVLLFFLAALYVLLVKKTPLYGVVLVSFSYLVHTTGLVFRICYLCLLVLLRKRYGFTNRNILGSVCFFVFVFWGHAYGLVALMRQTFWYDTVQVLGLGDSLEHTTHEILAVIAHFRTGFAHAGIWSFVEGIKRHITAPLFVLGVAGALSILFHYRLRREYGYLLVIGVVIFFFFGIKREASSHGSRYPMYITRILLLRAGVGCVSLLRQYSRSIVNPLLLGSMTLAVFLLPTSYYTSYVGGFRHIYKLNKEIGMYLGEQYEITEDNKLLYMGRPETTLGLALKDSTFDVNNYIAYGRLSQDVLNKITRQFVEENHIRYFLYEKTGGDYLDSFDQLRDRFIGDMRLLYELRDGPRTVQLYEFTDEGGE